MRSHPAPNPTPAPAPSPLPRTAPYPAPLISVSLQASALLRFHVPLVPKRNRPGTEAVPLGYHKGTTWVPERYHLGTGKVPLWYRKGTAFSPASLPQKSHNQRPKNNLQTLAPLLDTTFSPTHPKSQQQNINQPPPSASPHFHPRPSTTPLPHPSPQHSHWQTSATVIFSHVDSPAGPESKCIS